MSLFQMGYDTNGDCQSIVNEQLELRLLNNFTKLEKVGRIDVKRKC